MGVEIKKTVFQEGAGAEELLHWGVGSDSLPLGPAGLPADTGVSGPPLLCVEALILAFSVLL